jgi:hypothetical protein
VALEIVADGGFQIGNAGVRPALDPFLGQGREKSFDRGLGRVGRGHRRVLGCRAST